MLNGQLGSAWQDCLTLAGSVQYCVSIFSPHISAAAASLFPSACLQLLDQVLLKVSTDMIDLHKLVDGLALLDMMCSFAQTVTSSSEEYTRPVLTASGKLQPSRSPTDEPSRAGKDFLSIVKYSYNVQVLHQHP